MRKLTIYEVVIITGSFWSRTDDQNEFIIAAEDTRQARRIAIEVGEDEGLLKRKDIRRTEVYRRSGIVYGAY
jgi:hypothetical protein